MRLRVVDGGRSSRTGDRNLVTVIILATALALGTIGPLLVSSGTAGAAASAPSTTKPVPPKPSHGYWLVGRDGGIFSFGSAQFYGSTGNIRLQRPVVGITPTPDHHGYWLVATDGGIFAFGDAGFYGSIPGIGIHPVGSRVGPRLNAPVVGMVPSVDGRGYFMVAADGGVFAFGDAAFEGSCPGIGGCGGPAQAVMPDATGGGYWLVTTLGRVQAFGNAQFYGQPGQRSVGISAAVRTTDGRGYWILYRDGVVFRYGDAPNYGWLPSGAAAGYDIATSIFPTAKDLGYWICTAAGAVWNFGNAPNDGSMAGHHLNGAILDATGW